MLLKRNKKVLSNGMTFAFFILSCSASLASVVETSTIDERLNAAPPDVNVHEIEPSRIDESRYSVGRAERLVKIYPTNIHASLMNAFIAACCYERAKNQNLAAEQYELAITTLRTSKPLQDKKLARKIAKKYAHLLRQQGKRERAKSIENEFCKRSTSSHAVRRQKTSPTLPEGAPIPDSQKK